MTWLVWGCRCKRFQTVDGTKLGESQWRQFEQSLIWQAFLFDIEDREKFLTELLINGSPKWSDEQIRGRIHELEFFKQIPALIKLQIIQDAENNTTDNKES